MDMQKNWHTYWKNLAIRWSIKIIWKTSEISETVKWQLQIIYTFDDLWFKVCYIPF